MILSIGDIMLDVLLLPELAHEEQASGIVVRGGGSAANTAAWVRHLEQPATFVGCVGGDSAGVMLTSELQDSDVVTVIRKVSGLETGCVAVEITSDGERVMRSSRGANQALERDDIRRASTSQLAAVHITGYTLLGPGGSEILRAAAGSAKRAGGLLSFDPSSAGVVGRVGRAALLADVRGCRVDVFLPNQREAEALTGASDALEAASILGESVRLVVVKDGANGACYCRDGERGHVDTTALVPVDTTGAGDAFNAAILVGLLDGTDIATSIRRAHVVAARAISQFGGRP
jgi:ribokinase